MTLNIFEFWNVLELTCSYMQWFSRWMIKRNSILFFQELMNSGKERFVCFIHDFNLCRDCVQKSLKRREEPKTVLNKVNLAHPHGDLNCCSNAKIDHKTTKVSIDCELPTRPNRQSKPKMHHSKQSTPSVSDTRPTSEIEILDEESGQDAKKEDSRWSRSKSYAHAINTWSIPNASC